jgi:hypothetical protein
VLAVYAALPSAAPPRVERSGPALCLQDREHLDILPATWDIASPPLADLGLTIPTDPTAPNNLDLPTNAAPHPLDPPTDPAALALLIGELDDHLFALGLAPLRRCYLRAAAQLGCSQQDIFLLPPDLLQRLLRGEPHALELPRRRAEHHQQSDLLPPLQLFDGLPVPSPGGAYLRGLPIGPAAEGPLHPRRDLEDLIARPLAAGAVLAIPALTAQAAIVLRALGIRAVCSEHGGAMSHAALMARELGLSALIGCRGCTTSRRAHLGPPRHRAPAASAPTHLTQRPGQDRRAQIRCCPRTGSRRALAGRERARRRGEAAAPARLGLARRVGASAAWAISAAEMPALTRARSSLPTLKNGRRLGATCTASPVRGLRPS